MANETMIGQNDKRALIIAAARKLFLRNGFKRTSIDDVANEAGVAKGTVYLYVNSKSALVAEVARRFTEETFDEAKNALAEPNPPSQRLLGFLDAYVGKVCRHQANVPWAAEFVRVYETTLKEVEAAFEARFRSELRSALKEMGIEREDAADMLLAAAWGAYKTGDPDQESYRARLAAMIDILIVGLKCSQSVL
jgi:AcrR family transcriptional regulator